MIAILLNNNHLITLICPSQDELNTKIDKLMLNKPNKFDFENQISWFKCKI